MALTSPDNIWTPDSSDNYALTTDLAAMADTIQDAITDRIGGSANIERVANVAERNAALADHGTPSTSNPLIVFRADAGAGREIEYTTNGSTWYTVDVNEPVDTGWVNLSLTNGWSVQSGRTPRIRRIGKVVYLTGQVTGGNSGNVSQTFPVTFHSGSTLIFPTFTEAGTYLGVNASGYLTTNSTGSGLVLNYSWVAGDV